MKFKLDENIPVSMVRTLQGHGHDVLTAAAQGLSGAADSIIAKRLRAEGRCFVTLDLGFGDVRAYPPQEYAGIVVIRPQRQDRDAVLSLAEILLKGLAREGPPAERLWIIEPGRIRIHEPTGGEDAL